MSKRTMSFMLSTLAFIFLIRGAHADALLQKNVQLDRPHADGEIIVRLKPTQEISHLRSLNSAQVLGHLLPGIVIQSVLPLVAERSLMLLKLTQDAPLQEVLSQLNSNPRIAYAEPNYLLHITDSDAKPNVLPKDPHFDDLWALHNTGQLIGDQRGVPGADIDAVRAWDIDRGSRSVIVAVIDTGIDIHHDDLKMNIWTNPREIPNNGIDDDHNGVVDDIHGWNFADNSNNVVDDNGHGTMVAGVIGASGNNGIGVTGVNWNVSLMPIKFLTSHGGGTTADAVRAIDYALTMGANVLNNSWGSTENSSALADAIKRAEEKGVLVVASAGANGSSMDDHPAYPAAFPYRNIIAVATTDNRDHLTSYTTYGPESVDIAAPGHNIYSTHMGSRYAWMSGNSFSTAYVSGVAALVLAHHPRLSLDNLIDRLLSGSDELPDRNDAAKIASGGRINAYNALLGIVTPRSQSEH